MTDLLVEFSPAVGLLAVIGVMIWAVITMGIIYFSPLTFVRE